VASGVCPPTGAANVTGPEALTHSVKAPFTVLSKLTPPVLDVTIRSFASIPGFT
jgi:hypothetical protein